MIPAVTVPVLHAEREDYIDHCKSRTSNPYMTRCELCGREQPLTFHHLIPKAVHGKKRFQKRHTKHEMRSRGIKICRQCHSGIHDLISEKELAESFTTKESLLENAAIAKHIAWVRKQK